MPRPWIGIEATGPSASAALQGDETASLAAGKTMDVKTGVWRVIVDLPASRSRWASTSLRLGLGARSTVGRVGAVRLSELQALAPGVADLIVDTAEEFSGFVSAGGESLALRGADAFSGNLADRLELRDVGAELTLGFVAAGPTLAVANVEVELVEIELSGFLHLSRLTIELTNAQGSESRNGYTGFGFGLGFRASPLTIVIPAAAGLRIQPAALRADILGLLTRKNLRAVVVSLGWSAQLSLPFP